MGELRPRDGRAVSAAAMPCLALSLLLAAIGLVLWVGGGPHPRTRGAWLLLVAILIVAALPALLCWMFC